MQTSRAAAEPVATDASEELPITSDTSILEVVDYSGGFVAPDGSFTPVLEDVSFGVTRGELTAIVGETGSGKTLTALSMLGIQPRAFRRTAGSIFLEGQDMTRWDEKALRKVRGSKIAMVFQDARTAFNPVFTIATQIKDVARTHRSLGKKEALEATEDVLTRVRIPDPRRCMRQYPHELSGGLAQRAQLAMALICEPSLLILDEPTTGLDVTIQADIMDLIVDLNLTEGMSTLLITHDLGVVAECCSRVVVMQHGRVREDGSCEQIINRPDDSYTQMLIAASRLHEGFG
jgi:ABC-type glutathione transport system ATPase component